MLRFYLDTSIWIDFLEDRMGYNGEPFGEYAWKLIHSIIESDSRIIISDVCSREIQKNCILNKITILSTFLKEKIEFISASHSQIDEARILSERREVPLNDVIHAILARDNNLIMIARDNHFNKLKDIISFLRPEDAIF